MASNFIPAHDEDCPIVVEFSDTLFDDPMSDAMGAPTDEIMRAFLRRHRRNCSRCQNAPPNV